MPELPDVEIFHRLVDDRCRGKRIAEAAVGDAGILEGISPEALERRLAGQRIRSSRRHGKHLFILLDGARADGARADGARADGAGALVLHFGTNGSLRLVSRGEAEPPYTRLRLDLDGGDRLAYVNPRRIGRVSLGESVEAFVAEKRLGPDALDPALDLGAFRALLAGAKRDVKTVLMDQALIAGIGNIYSDEILFQARIHPFTAAARLDDESASGLFRAMRRTLETAIRCRAGSEQGMERLPRDFLLPERHRGGRCPRCGTPLAIAKHGGRTSYHCPRCQPG